MRFTIVPSQAPEVLPKKVERVVADARKLGFRDLGWIEVRMITPLHLYALVDETGYTQVALNGVIAGSAFDLFTTDIVSHLDGDRKLTTSTAPFVVSQPYLGLYKYSFPRLGFRSLLLEHEKRIKRMRAKPCLRVDSLSGFIRSVRVYLKKQIQ